MYGIGDIKDKMDEAREKLEVIVAVLLRIEKELVLARQKNESVYTEYE